MKIFVITKRTLLIVAAALIVLIAAIALGFTITGRSPKREAKETSARASIGRAVSVKEGDISALIPSSECYELKVLAGFRKELPIYSVDRTDKKIALTIDAAWDDDKTAFILETLERYNVKATFFLCGSWVKAYPEQVKAISDAGHTIGNHSLTHPHMSRLSEAQIKEEIEKLDDLIEAITGKRTDLFRAPYGEYNDKVILAVRSSGHEPIQWDVDTIDWKPERSSQTILDTVLKKLGSGSIILCHNNGYKIEEYLPTLIETAQANGYEFVRVEDLLLTGETLIDVNGVQKAK